MRQPRLISILALSAYCLFIRLLPFIFSHFGLNISQVGFYPWTFMPAFAYCLFSVGMVKDWRMALGLPFLVQLLGDVAIGVIYGMKFGMADGIDAAIYPDQAFVYLAILLMCGMGWIIRNWRNPLTIALGAIASPTLFFLVTNFGSWMSDPDRLYTNDLAGLFKSFALGLPFYYPSLVSTAIYTAIFFSPAFASLMFTQEVSAAETVPDAARVR